jgi:hypothetical protein
VLLEKAAYSYRLFSVQKNSGNGNAVFKALLESLHEKGVDKLYQRTYCKGDDLSSNSLISRYQKLGFQRLNEQEERQYNQLFLDVPCISNVEENRIRLVLDLKNLNDEVRSICNNQVI